MWLHKPTWRKNISFLAFACCICMHFQIMVHGSTKCSGPLGRETRRSIFDFVQVMMRHRSWGEKWRWRTRDVKNFITFDCSHCIKLFT
jgi:hypothetical protein